MDRAKFAENPILQRSLDFSKAIWVFVKRFKHPHHLVLTRQLLRSSTSIGANCMEAQNAESKADFIHKLKLAAKEAEEAQYWLMILESDPEFEGVDDLAGRLDEVQRLLASIISSSKRATAGKVG